MLFLILLLAVFPNYAFAYIDPGTGSVILQALLAGFAGVAVAGRFFWFRIKSFFLAPKNTTEKSLDNDKYEKQSTDDSNS